LCPGLRRELPAGCQETSQLCYNAGNVLP
jgi:hypothetical protein